MKKSLQSKKTPTAKLLRSIKVVRSGKTINQNKTPNKNDRKIDVKHVIILVLDLIVLLYAVYEHFYQ